MPREVVFLDELPRNPTGKVLRSKLAEYGYDPEAGLISSSLARSLANHRDRAAHGAQQGLADRAGQQPGGHAPAA